MAAQIKEGMTGGQVADIIEQNFENLENKFQQLSDQFDHLKEDINRTLDEYQSQIDDAYGSLVVSTDEEDTTTVNGKITFKDRAYEPDKFSGKGYKILRKNIVCNTETGESKNILTQDMINDANTVYEIRYDFDLNGETINIPEGCTLKFEGGSLSNGAINGNVTYIQSPIYQIFKNLNIEGIIKSSKAYPEWFGALGDGITDDTTSIQATLDSFEYTNIYFLNTYKISSSPYFWYNCEFLIQRNGLSLYGNGSKTFVRDNNAHVCFVTLSNDTNFLTKNVKYSDSTLYVDSVDGYNIGDDILIVGEDGFGEDKAEPREWVFAVILQINSEDKSITINKNVGFNIDITNCNTVGTISTATTNGGIRRISCKDLKFYNFEDTTQYTTKSGSFIYLNEVLNVEVQNLLVTNQSSVTFKFAENILLNNIVKQDNHGENDKFSVTNIILWEATNVVIQNATNYFKGYITPGRPPVLLTLEGSSRNVKAINLINRISSFIEPSDYTRSYNCINLSEGCQISVDNMYFYCVTPHRIYTASFNDTNSISKAYCYINNLYVSSLEEGDITALNNRDRVIINNFIYNDSYNGSHFFSKRDVALIDDVYTQEYDIVFSNGKASQLPNNIKNITITKAEMTATKSGEYHMVFVSENTSSIDMTLEANVKSAQQLNIQLLNTTYYLSASTSNENFNGILKVKIYYKYNDSSVVPNTIYLSSGIRSNRPYDAPTGFLYFDTENNRPIFKQGLNFYDALGNMFNALNYGSLETRPDNSNIKPGFVFYNTNYHKLTVYNGSKFVDYFGNGDVYLEGVTSNRPNSPNKGTIYFDTTLNKPIWWTGTKWVDATGTDV